MGPLTGLRVIELASIGPGPMCAMLLADMGADVVRIDRLQAADLGLPVDPRFEVLGRSRRSVALDLKQAAGRDAVLQLLDSADVLIEGWRPGVAERLGLGPEVCLQREPGLVYGRMTGYGQTGPLAQAAGHDINYIALSGALHAMGAAGGGPVPPLNLVGDFGGGALYLALGLLAALFERQRSGRGQVVDAAMVDGSASLMGMFHGLAAAGLWDANRRGVNVLDGGVPWYGSYATADGAWLAIGPLEPRFFAELIQRIGLPTSSLADRDDPARWPALRQALTDCFLQRTRAEWCALLEGSDACVAPVLSLSEAPLHPHAQARGAYVEVAGMTQPAPAPRFDRSPAGLPRPAPALGEHTVAVLRAAGWSADAVADLLRRGVAFQAPAVAAAPDPDQQETE